MRHHSLRDRAVPTPELLDRREKPRTVDWVCAGLLITAGLWIFGGAIWVVFIATIP